MKWILYLVILIPVVILTFFIFSALKNTSAASSSYASNNFTDYDFHKGRFVLRSLSFFNKEKIPAKYTCDGENINPVMRFYNVPEKAKSLAFTITDPDAPSGEFVHWIVWNIDPNVQAVQEDTVPKGGIQGVNSYGNRKYQGPCPPSGMHRYSFKLYALDEVLDIPKKSGIDELNEAMKEHIIDDVGLVGEYARD